VPGNILVTRITARCSRTPWALAPQGRGCTPPSHHARRDVGYARGAWNVRPCPTSGPDGAPGAQDAYSDGVAEREPTSGLARKRSAPWGAPWQSFAGWP
jgi:hypothetical protein